ncbi:MAG: class I SAM-dependent methyltransferase [Bacteroidetes bacterium]|nr:class I SAM-dependent methyltransferase [Bacteroidota bacterium]
MKSKEKYNEAFIYDESSLEREALTVEPRFGAFLHQVVGSGHLVLDIGCGTGRYTVHSKRAGNTVIGSELVFSAARGARRRGLDVIVADSETGFPFADATFDRAQCIEVIEHLMDPVSTLQEINRVLKPGGELFISTPNAAWWAHRTLMLCGITSFGHSPTYPVEVNMHIRHFTKATLRDFLLRMGFEVVRTQGTYTGFPGALTEYFPSFGWLFGFIGKITGGLGFLAKKNIWPSLTSAGLVFHVRKIGLPESA